MNSVNKTLYIPLYGKAYVSQKCLLLHDQKAEEIWVKAGFALHGKAASKWLAYYMGMRAAVFDRWVIEQLAATQDAIVIHIGCGLDSRVLRVGEVDTKWYDIDFENVITERKLYYSQTKNYRMISGDVRVNTWLEKIPETKHAIVVMEGVSMYLQLAEMKSFIAALQCHFESFTLLLDGYTSMAAKMSKFKNPIKTVGVTNVYGLDDPEELCSNGVRFVKEHNMTPSELIEQLSGIEKYIFRKLYAGKISKKLYRLYEYVGIKNDQISRYDN